MILILRVMLLTASDHKSIFDKSLPNTHPIYVEDLGAEFEVLPWDLRHTLNYYKGSKYCCIAADGVSSESAVFILISTGHGELRTVRFHPSFRLPFDLRDIRDIASGRWYHHVISLIC